MSVGIDKTTKLPKLPENQFWRIGDSIISIVELVPTGEWSEWGANEWRNHRSDYESEVRPITTRGKSALQYRWRSRATERFVFTKYYGRWWHESGVIGNQLIKPDPITAKNIVNRTTETLLEHQAKALLAEEQAAIQGDYPPKRLESK